MKVTGEATLRATVPAVYAALHDPAVLVATIPGCERLERTGPDAYEMVVSAGVATIRGTYAGQVRLTDTGAPHAFLLSASGTGAPGTVAADVAVRLADGPDGTTTWSYDADADVGGMIGGVGQRMLASVARRTAQEFFTAVDAVLTGTPAAPGATVPVLSTPDGTPTVYTRPSTVAGTGGLPAGFLTGAVAGAVIALAGALVGGRLARRRGGRSGRA